MSKGKIIEEFKKIPLPIYFQAYNKEAQSELVRFSKEVIQPFLEQALTSHTEELKKMIEERLAKKREAYKEFGLREDEGEISALLEVKRMLSELNHQ